MTNDEIIGALTEHITDQKRTLEILLKYAKTPNADLQSIQTRIRWMIEDSANALAYVADAGAEEEYDDREARDRAIDAEIARLREQTFHIDF